MEAEHLRRHACAWPGILEMIRQCNIRNYTIFLRDGVSFTFYEYVGTDHESDMALKVADPTTQAWWKVTDPYEQAVDTAAEGEWWVPVLATLPIRSSTGK